VAQFVGAANVIEGRVHSVAENALLIHSDVYDCELLVEHHQPMDIGASVAVALRPEKVLMSEQEATDRHSVNRISGTVAEIAYLGDISVYHVRTAGGKMLLAQLTNRDRLKNPGPTWEQPVHLSWHSTSGVVLTA
jgi:putrescine transport system ATP-binding protein